MTMRLPIHGNAGDRPRWLRLAEGRWCWRMLRALHAQSPRSAPLYTLLFIVSQITLLVALLVPWSILASLSLGHASLALQTVFGELESPAVVALTMATVLACFALHLACEAAGARQCRRAAEGIVARHAKVGIPDILRERGAADYARFLRLFARLCYCLIATVLIALIYPVLLAVLFVYIIAAVLIISALPSARLQAAQAELRGKAWWGTGFLLLVGWIIHDAWQGALPQFWAVYGALLLARQILIFLMQSATTYSALLGAKERVEALFLAKEPLRRVVRQDAGWKALLRAPLRDLWLGQLLRGMGSAGFHIAGGATQWAEQGNVLYMVAEAPDPGDGRALLIKVFHQSLAEIGRQERDLLQGAAVGWPAPELLGEQQIEGGHLVMVFRWHSDWPWFAASSDRNATLALREELFACEITPDLADRYARSHARLPQNLAEIDLPMLAEFCATDEMAARMAALERCWPAILDWLNRFPSQIVLPRLTLRRSARGAGNRTLICNWTRWRWEPVGFDWPFRQRPASELRQSLARASRHRPALAVIRPEEVLLVSMLAEFSRLNVVSDLAGMLELIGELEAAVERCGIAPNCSCHVAISGQSRTSPGTNPAVCCGSEGAEFSSMSSQSGKRE